MKFLLIEKYDNDIVTLELIEIIKSQMEFIGSNISYNEITNFLNENLNIENNAKLLILKDESIVGFCFFNISVGLETKGKYIWLNEVHILKQYRGLGYGNLIIEYLDNYSKENSIKKVMGLVSNENESKSFYKNNGFRLNSYLLFDKDIK